jgi:prepilin-type N-terminal cleavage/methylation domain-containing protein
MKSPRHHAFTLIELLVVISIIAILASIAVPVFGEVLTKGAQTKALSNAKQIGLACRLFADDYNGLYPTKKIDPNTSKLTTTDVASSNEAFRQLIPDYIQTEQIFYVPKSKFTPVQPDDRITEGEKLKEGENHFAYVLNITTSSPSNWPLIADGFDQAGAHTYAKEEAKKGGVWKGKKAIVVHADNSASLEKVNNNLKVPGSPNGNDLFDNSGQEGWLGPDSIVVNPL